MKQTKKIILLFLSIAFSPLFAQDDVSQFFDDGGISTSKNQLKTNLAAMVNGDWTINYQRKFSDRFYIEAGIGKTTPTYSLNIIDPDYIYNINSYKGGYSFSLNPKIRYAGDDRFCLTIGAKYRVRNYEKKQLTIKDGMLYSTAEYIIGNHIVLEFDFGYGISSITETFNGHEVSVAVPFDLKIGYTF